MEMDLKKMARSIFEAAVAAVAPEVCIQKHLKRTADIIKICNVVYSLADFGRIFLIGIGKASAAMTLSAEKILEGHIYKSLVVTKVDHGIPIGYGDVLEAGHPIPDAAGEKAANRILDLVSSARPDDLILCLISGGGSALTPAPVKGIDLADKQEVTRQLLGCGATIHEINTIRKHLSRIKGGNLCRKANRAKIISLILSDVIGDDIDMIASGMTAPDRTDFNMSADILTRYNLWETIPETVRHHIEKGMSDNQLETPKPGSPYFDHVQNHVVGSISDALTAAKKKAEQMGFNTLILSSTIQGEASETGKFFSSLAKEIHRHNTPLKAPACILSGGETTVTIKGTGKGGRNMELALSAGIDMAGLPGTVLLSAGTDGTDGPTEAAGAYADGSTLARGDQLGLNAGDCLANNNSYPFFQALDDLLITGPTRTNVMDLQILLVEDFNTVIK